MQLRDTGDVVLWEVVERSTYFACGYSFTDYRRADASATADRPQAVNP
jgi:hypothetical protein